MPRYGRAAPTCRRGQRQPRGQPAPDADRHAADHRQVCAPGRACGAGQRACAPPMHSWPPGPCPPRHHNRPAAASGGRHHTRSAASACRRPRSRLRTTSWRTWPSRPSRSWGELSRVALTGVHEHACGCVGACAAAGWQQPAAAPIAAPACWTPSHLPTASAACRCRQVRGRAGRGHDAAAGAARGAAPAGRGRAGRARGLAGHLACARGVGASALCWACCAAWAVCKDGLLAGRVARLKPLQSNSAPAHAPCSPPSPPLRPATAR